MGKADGFLRSAFCLAVFRERGLLELAVHGDDIDIHLAGRDKKVRLEDSIYIRRLTDAETGRGGGGSQ